MKKQIDLIQKIFKPIDDDTYIFQKLDGEFLLGPEYCLNEKYTVRDYKINSNNQTMLGKIYTNDEQNFCNTLHRLLKEFNRNREQSTVTKEFSFYATRIDNKNTLTAV